MDDFCSSYTVRGQVRSRSRHFLRTVDPNLKVWSTLPGPGPGPPQTRSGRSGPGLVQVWTRFEWKKMKYIEDKLIYIIKLKVSYVSAQNISFNTQPPIHISSLELLKPTEFDFLHLLSAWVISTC